MIPKPSISIQPSERPLRPLPEKQIFRPPCYQGDDSSLFPDTNQIYSRRNASNTHDFLIDVFFEAISHALERVLIVDNYFFKPHEGKGDNEDEKIDDRIDILLLPMESRSFQASEVKIISGCDASETQRSLQAKLQAKVDRINSQLPRPIGNPSISIEYKILPDRLIHDRFAIIDDELWHFGGTVGGFEKQFSVASRGWRASEYGADALFHNIWRL
ncbi:hypothetical protein [Thiothrix nivea]|uniref:Uncharacterized protein n=1 Tax=Thiothrix nivea (strain ATCC 35100 / DSM 5205 / JP2) TaxID=870187 RepID=A0A656HHD5_THINJ|nr:hypothetical protein [Thiothrix nivea]EIJ34790.1 hypothetical protein Thini_2227 [Thiothrix nivea DSM 5205]